MKNQQMNFNQLYYFHMIAQLDSLNDAAKFLNISTSTLSEHLRSLEDKLGMQLFDRVGRKLEINDMGRRAHLRTSQMFEVSETMLRELAGDSDKLPYLDIGITPSLSKLHTVQILEPLFQNQKFKVRIKEATFPTLVNSLLQRELSLVICSDQLPPRLGKNLVSKTLVTAPYVFVVGSEGGELKKDFPKCLEQKPFFNYTLESEIRWQIDRFFKDNNLEITEFGEVDDVSIQRAATRSNMCISLIPQDLVRDHVKNGLLHILGDSLEIEANIHGIYHGSSHDKVVKDALALILEDKEG